MTQSAVCRALVVFIGLCASWAIAATDAPDITKLVQMANVAPPSDSISKQDSTVHTDSVAHVIFSATDTLKRDSIAKTDSLHHQDSLQISHRPALIKWELSDKSQASKGLPLALYLGGGDGGAWYALGVLQAVEQFRIPLTKVSASGPAAWVAALWSEGYSLKDIQARMQRVDSMSPALLWSTAEASSSTNVSHTLPSLPNAVSSTGFPAFSLMYTVLKDSLQAPYVTPALIPQTASLSSANLAKLLLQEPLLNLTTQTSGQAARIPWSVLACDEPNAQVVESLVRPSLDVLSNASGLSQRDHNAKRWAPLETCGTDVVTHFAAHDRQLFWLLAISWPERANGSTPAMLRAQVDAMLKDTTLAKIWIRPHVTRQDSSDSKSYWQQQGFAAVRERLGDLRGMKLTPKIWPNVQVQPPSLETVQPAFENVSAEYQNHLESYWPDSLPWDQRVVRFSNAVQQSLLYDSLAINVVAQKTNDPGDGHELNVPVLAVQASPEPRAELALGGFGSSIVGPEVAGRASLRFVNQLEFNFSVTGFYGSVWRGVAPTVTLSRIHGGTIAFEGDAELTGFHGADLYNHLGAASVNDLYSRLTSEDRQNANMRVLWQISPDYELRSVVQIGNSTFNTPMTSQLDTTMHSATVSSLDAHAEFESMSNRNNPYFMLAGFHLWGQAGFRSVSLQNASNPSAPLYSREQARINWAYPLTSNIHIGLEGEAGIDGMVRNGNTWEYPDSLILVEGGMEDPAIANQYKMQIRPTPFSTLLPLPQFASHGYTCAVASFAVHAQGNGLWIFAAMIHDIVGPNEWDNLAQTRLTLEPMFRLHWKSLELLMGGQQTANSSQLANLSSLNDWTGIFQVGFPPF